MKKIYAMKKILLLSFGLALIMIGCKKDNDTTSTAQINSVTLKSWPTNDSLGIAWDSASSPDIYLELLDANLIEVSNDPLDDTTFVDATGSVLRYELITPYRLASPESNYYIDVLDDDTIDSDDNMGKVMFNLGNYPNHPSSITLEDSTVGVTVEVGLQWL